MARSTVPCLYRVDFIKILKYTKILYTVNLSSMSCHFQSSQSSLFVGSGSDQVSDLSFSNAMPRWSKMLHSAAVRSLGPTFTGSSGRMVSQRQLGTNGPRPEISSNIQKSSDLLWVTWVTCQWETQITRTEHIKKDKKVNTIHCNPLMKVSSWMMEALNIFQTQNSPGKKGMSMDVSFCTLTL